MKKITVIVLMLMVCVTFAQRRSDRDQIPSNITMVMRDTLRVDGTEALWSKLFWQAKGAEKTLQVIFDDTTSAGVASDSAAVKIEMFQVWNTPNDNRKVTILASRANPDSTSWPYSSNFVMVDSLDILSMDSAAVWDRLQIPIRSANGDTTGYTWGDDLDSVYTGGYVGSAYYPVVPDASPGIIFKVTGKASNKVGSYSRLILKLFQITGAPTKIQGN